MSEKVEGMRERGEKRNRREGGKREREKEEGERGE